jgi:hypothetical protein
MIVASQRKTVISPHGKTNISLHGKMIIYPHGTGKTIISPYGKTIINPNGKKIISTRWKIIISEDGRMITSSCRKTVIFPRGETTICSCRKTLISPLEGDQLSMWYDNQLSITSSCSFIDVFTLHFNLDFADITKYMYNGARGFISQATIKYPAVSKNIVYRRTGRTVHHNFVRVKVGPPVHNYEHEAGSYGDGFT